MAAAEVKISYENYKQTIIYKPNCDPIKGIATEEDCFYKAPKPKIVAAHKAGYGRYDCVKFVKDLVGVYGTWGDGARRLSLNSSGDIGDVAVFAGIIHTGLVIDRQVDQVTIREWMTTKTSAYEQIRTLSVNSFLGFHKF